MYRNNVDSFEYKPVGLSKVLEDIDIGSRLQGGVAGYFDGAISLGGDKLEAMVN